MLNESECYIHVLSQGREERLKWQIGFTVMKWSAKRNGIKQMILTKRVYFTHKNIEDIFEKENLHLLNFISTSLKFEFQVSRNRLICL